MAEKTDSNGELEERNVSEEEKQTGVKPTAEPDADQVLSGYSELEESAIIRKVDFRLVPLLSILYLYVSLQYRRISKSNCSAVLPTLAEATLEMPRSLAWRKTSS